MSRPQHRLGPVLGTCYVCRQPVRAKEATQVYDSSVGWDRRVHRGACQERAEQLFGPKVEGGTDE